MATLTTGRRPRSRETAASVAVVAVLVAVAAWLWSAQARFSPAVTVASSAAQLARGGAPARATTAPADVLASWPEGVRAMGPAESFTPETLSDKIDGKAELYLPAGFAGLRCQRVQLGATPAAWLEVFIYDMAKPENAFAVYSSQKRTATKDAGVGDYGYVAGNQLCLVHGHYYLELVGADEAEPTRLAALELARSFIAATAVAAHANVGRDEALFPTQGLIGAVMLLSADVFGFDQLDHTYVARYREGTDELSLFVTRRASEAEASRLGGALRDFFVKDCGGKELAPPAAPSGAKLVDGGGTVDGFFVVGAVVAGVHQAPTRESAEAALRRISERLQASKP